MKFSASDDKKYHKVRYCHFTGKYRSAANSICNLRCKILIFFLIRLPPRSTHDYDFIIKELAKELDG